MLKEALKFVTKNTPKELVKISFDVTAEANAVKEGERERIIFLDTEKIIHQIALPNINLGEDDKNTLKILMVDKTPKKLLDAMKATKSKNLMTALNYLAMHQLILRSEVPDFGIRVRLNGGINGLAFEQKYPPISIFTEYMTTDVIVYAEYTVQDGNITKDSIMTGIRALDESDLDFHKSLFGMTGVLVSA